MQNCPARHTFHKKQLVKTALPMHGIMRYAVLTYRVQGGGLPANPANTPKAHAKARGTPRQPRPHAPHAQTKLSALFCGTFCSPMATRYIHTRVHPNPYTQTSEPPTQAPARLPPVLSMLIGVLAFHITTRPATHAHASPPPARAPPLCSNRSTHQLQCCTLSHAPQLAVRPLVRRRLELCEHRQRLLHQSSVPCPLMSTHHPKPQSAACSPSTRAQPGPADYTPPTPPAPYLCPALRHVRPPAAV